jgi:hypothetical protein
LAANGVRQNPNIGKIPCGGQFRAQFPWKRRSGGLAAAVVAADAAADGAVIGLAGSQFLICVENALAPLRAVAGLEW